MCISVYVYKYTHTHLGFGVRGGEIESGGRMSSMFEYNFGGDAVKLGWFQLAKLERDLILTFFHAIETETEVLYFKCFKISFEN